MSSLFMKLFKQSEMENYYRCNKRRQFFEEFKIEDKRNSGLLTFYICHWGFVVDNKKIGLTIFIHFA